MSKLPGILKRDFGRNVANKMYNDILEGLQSKLHAAIPDEKKGLRAAIKDLKIYKSLYLGDLLDIIGKELEILLEELDK